ncbi:MAG TPA: AI-2E family transporter [Solirubrobacteraceae bacterium]|nr:AI-2E family transporter [Solirubrobacteraceae bacterium]
MTDRETDRDEARAPDERAPRTALPVVDPEPARGLDPHADTEPAPAPAAPDLLGAAPPAAPSASDPVPGWLRAGAAIGWRLLVVVAAIAVTAYALAYLRIVVLPIIVAVLVSTVLRPPTRWLIRHRFSAGAAALTVLLAAIALLVAALAMAGAAVARQVSDLADSVKEGIREAGDALSAPPFNVSDADIDRYIDNAGEQLSDSSGALTGGVVHGAVIAGEVITGLIITLLLLFFFLKDGPSIWRWIVDTFGGRRRRQLDELARRSYTALTGYVRGLFLVGAADATMIGAGLAVLGVPLVIPLMLLTFLGAFVPLIGAFTAGLAAVLIALVDGGIVTALIVLGLVVAVQQVEGHLLYPLIMGRTIHIHPIAVILALATGGITAGIIGVFISVPILTLAATALAYVREMREAEEPAPAPAPAVADA